MCRVDPIVERAMRKAAQSNCRFLVAAMGFNKAGVVVSAKTNRPRFCREGGGEHAEQLVMREAKRKGVVRILICRVGRKGTLLPIDPCPRCQKTSEKLGIEIITVPLENS